MSLLKGSVTLPQITIERGKPWFPSIWGFNLGVPFVLAFLSVVLLA
ncbi:MAG: hypothetical protein QXH77_04180 [Desulfurococcaceae archaeon]